MTPPRSSRVTFGTLVDGFEQARGKFNNAANQNELDEKAVFFALFEVVAWAGATGDWLLKSQRRRNKARPNPPTIQGLWYVRNRVLHYGAQAVYHGVMVMPGAFGSAGFGRMGFGGAHVVRTLTWRPRTALPKGVGVAGKQEYEAHLAKQPVSNTLAVASAELASRSARRPRT
jgi:hypothetical protein